MAHVGWSSVLTGTVAHWAALFVPPPPLPLAWSRVGLLPKRSLSCIWGCVCQGPLVSVPQERGHQWVLCPALQGLGANHW